ncbi:MAG: hypothetical protein Q8M99_03575 [Methylotenera sp.]|nr:hypothetical protein [Methylotenera sp.]
MTFHYKLIEIVESGTHTKKVLSIVQSASHRILFLAKTASNMQKLDGCIMIQKNELPRRLFGLKMRDL